MKRHRMYAEQAAAARKLAGDLPHQRLVATMTLAVC